MTRATATIDTGSRNSSRCHQPIRGQLGGPWTNQRLVNSFPWPGPDRRSQTTDLFWSQETANHDNILSLCLWLSHYLRLCLSLECSVFVVVVSVCPSNGLYNTQQWGDHWDLWPITQKCLLFSQRRRDFFSDIKIPVKLRMLGVRQSSNLLHLANALLSVSQYCDYV